MVSCRGKVHSKEEYDRLCKEMHQCREMAFSHGNVLVSFILAYIGATLSVIIGRLDVILSNQNAVAFIPLSIALLSIPLYIIYPAVLKFHDNVRSMACLAAYMKVFYELPSILRKDEATSNSKNDVISWESLRIQAVIPNAKWIGREYFILAIATLFSSFFVFIFLVINCFFSCECSKTVFWIIVLICFVWIVLNFVFFLNKIRKNSDTKMMFMVYPNVYLNEYLTRAVDFQIITEEEKNEYLKLAFYSAMRDEKISTIIREYNSPPQKK